MKIGPVVAMVVVVGLTFWIYFSTAGASKVASTPGAVSHETLVAHNKVTVELITTKDASGQITDVRFRYLNWPEVGAEPLTPVQYAEIIEKEGGGGKRHWLLQAMNVTTWPKLAWVGLGLGGQLIFAGRMLVQWVASEKHRKSVVPIAFWYMSLAGGIALTAYFIWRHDPIGVLGQSFGLVVYVRNIYLMWVSTKSPVDAAPAHT